MIVKILNLLYYISCDKISFYNKRKLKREIFLMAQQKQGFLSRLIIGTEKSEGYARASLPSNRWELFFDIFKGNYKKLIGINLLMLLFFLPLFVLIFFQTNMTMSLGMACPYSQGFGVGYQSVTSFVGYAETIAVRVNFVFYMLLPVVCLIAAVGVAGGAYVIRNLVWTEGVFVANDFWKGVKQNIKQMLLIALFYSVILYSSILAVSFANQAIALETAPIWLMMVCKIGSLVFLGFFTIVMMHMVTVSVTYQLTFTKVMRNGFVFTLGLLPQNVFFAVVAIAPFGLMAMGGIMTIIGIFLALLISLSYTLLVWTIYSHWMYDKFINDRVEGAQKNWGIYFKVKEHDSEALARHGEMMTTRVRCSLNSRPIKPITDDELTIAELPTSFNRSDIARLAESKKVLYEDNERYIEEHKDDEIYKVEEQPQEQTKEDKKREKRIEKAKKELAKRNKK